MAFVPIDFIKNGRTETADTPAQVAQYEWEGWTRVGPTPPTPNLDRAITPRQVQDPASVASSALRAALGPGGTAGNPATELLAGAYSSLGAYSLADPRWGAKADAKAHLIGGAITAGSAIFTSSVATFSSTDVGKLIMVRGAGPATSGSNPSRELITTISAVTNATTVTLAATAATTVTGAEWGYGSDNTAALGAVLDAIAAAGSGVLSIPPGGWAFRPITKTVSKVVITGTPDSVLYGAQNTNSNLKLLRLVGDDVTVDNFTIDFLTAVDKDAHTFIRGGADHTIQIGDDHWSGTYRARAAMTRMRIFNSRNSPLTVQGYRTILVSKNYCDTTLGNGFFIGNGDKSIRVLDNYVRNTGDDCTYIYVGDGNRSVCDSIVVSGNDYANSYAKAIAIAGCGSAVISGNRVEQTWAAAILISSFLDTGAAGTTTAANVLVADNVVEGAGRYFGTGQYKATAQAGGSYGITAGNHVHGLSIVDNIVSGSISHGIQIAGNPATDVRIHGNLLLDNAGRPVSVANVGSAGDHVVGLSVCDNKSSGSAGGMEIGKARNVKISGNETSKYNVSGTGNYGLILGYLTDGEVGNNVLFNTDGATGGFYYANGSVNTQITRRGNAYITAGGTTPDVTFNDKATAAQIDTASVAADPAITAAISAAAAGGWTPGNHGLISWSMDPALCSGATAPTSGQVILVRLHISAATTINNIVAVVATAGTALTAGQCFAGLYSAAGAKLGETADQSSAWATTGVKTMPLTSPVAVQAGDYYVALLAVGTTPPAWARGSVIGALANIGITATTSRFGVATGSSVTALPSSLTVGATSTAYWAAAS